MEYGGTVENESLDQLLGKWKVLDIEDNTGDRSSSSASASNVNTDLAGVEFTLDDHGDVTWLLPSGVEVNGLFLTTSYRLGEEDMKFIDNTNGASYKFSIELGPGMMRLTAKLERRRNGVCINCQQIQEPKSPTPLTFQLLPALEEGFFSDLSIRSEDGTKFNVHRVVLGNRITGMKYRDWEMLLSGKPQELLRTMLHYVYTDSLPVNLTQSVAREVEVFAKAHPKFSELSKLCASYLEKYALKSTITEIIQDLHQRIDTIKTIVTSLPLSDPAKLVYAVHQITKEVGIICVRFVVLCETYLRRKDELTKAERKEILEYTRGRVPMFLDQSREAIELILEKWQSIPMDQKYEIAHYLLPEVNRIWDLLAGMVRHGKEAFSKVHSQVQKESKKFSKKISEHIYLVSHLGEMRRLRKLQRELEGSSGFIEVILQKEVKFDVLEDDSKVGRMLQVFSSIERSLAQAVKQLQSAKRMILVENILEWKQWKLYVSYVTSHLTWILAKVHAAGDLFKPVAVDVCRHIGQKTFNDSVVSLGLLSESELPRGSNDDSDITVVTSSSSGASASAASSTSILTMAIQLPQASSSILAQGISKLLCSHELSDMEFIVVTPPTSPSDTPTSENIVIPAHRVIVAARCEYFRMALQSGMKESIDRKIVIHDMEEATFRSFLTFVYSGILETDKMSMEEIIEMLAIADRYEMVSLKLHCEQILIGQVKDPTAFLLLAIADRYSAIKLRERTMSIILDRPDLKEKEQDAFTSLPQDLKTEILQLFQAGPATTKKKVKTPSKDAIPKIIFTIPPDISRERHISSSSSSDDSVPSSWDSNTAEPVEPLELMSSHIEQLRNVVGDEPTDEVLSEILLAADMDINRAINFYFNLT